MTFTLVSAHFCCTVSVILALTLTEVTDLTLVHGHVVFVRVAFADGTHAVQAGGYDDGGHLGE